MVAKESEFVDLRTLFKKPVLAKLHTLNIFKRTITLIGGPSLSGKTATSLHFANECVLQGLKVIYVDTDDHPVMDRPAPNLLENFMNQEPKLYQQHFKYLTSFDEESVLQLVDTEKPALLVIDSIYVPFAKKYTDGPLRRAKAIRTFLYQLRERVTKNDLSVLLTTQVSKETRMVKDYNIYAILGGEGLKHLSDIKWLIDFPKNKNDKATHNGKRLLLIDKQEEKVMIIEQGGIITEVK